MLAAVWLVAFGLRCLYLWQISHAPFFDVRIGDAEAYHLWARRIAGGDWLGQDVFYQAPLYPYVLAVIYRILGDSVTTVRLVQAAIGAGSCALLAAAGLSLFGRRGAIAGLGLAIYPSAIFLDGLLEKSALVTFFTAALLAALATRACGHASGRKREARSAREASRSLGAGALLGLLALTRENALLLVAPVLLWIGVGPGGPRLRAALVFLAGCAAVLLPVGLRNVAVGGEFHLTTSQFGPNFYIGNHAGATGTYEALVVGHGSAADEREDATRLAEQAEGRKLTPDEVSAFWTKRALDDIRTRPIDWLKLIARKAALTFNAAEIADTESQDVYAEWSWLLRALRPFDFGLLFGMAALGTALTARSWRRLWFLYAVGGTYALSVVVFYVFARYRFPLVPVLMILAAGGVVEALARLKARPSERGGRIDVAVAAGAAVVAVALAHLPLENARASRATHYAGIATALSKEARPDEAIGFYKRALEEAPEFPAAQFGLATLLTHLGRPEEAVPLYRAALRSWPAHAEAHYNLGLALAATGHTLEAAQQYTEALRIRPDEADTHIALAKVLIALQRPDLAEQHYQQGLAIQPRNVKALVGLGVALTQLGRPEEAIARYRAALELDPDDAAAHNNLGWTLASQGHVAEAVPHFERALAINPGDTDARRNLDQARQLLR